MSTDICITCKNIATLICTCTDINLCENCLGHHLLQSLVTKHRPMRLIDYKALKNPASPEEVAKPNTKASIISKLANEILEIDEFRKITLQRISEMVQHAEKELLATVEEIMVKVSDECENIQRDLRNAIALLRLPEPPENPILSMFDTCQTPDHVRELNIICKDANIIYPNLKEIISSSIVFTMMTRPYVLKDFSQDRYRSHSYPLRVSNFLSEKNESDSEVSNQSMISKASTISSNKKSKTKDKSSNSPVRLGKFQDIEMELKTKSHIVLSIPDRHDSFNQLSPLLKPYVLYFYPYSNKFTIYNVIEATLKKIELPNRIFLDHSNWSLTETGSIVQTGGTDTVPGNDVFMFKILTQRVEKCPKMLFKRCKHAQVSLGNYVYVIGGYNKVPLKFVERLNLLNLKWKKAANLNVARVFAISCSHQSKIYVSGGEDVASIEVYNAIDNKFNLLPLKLIDPGRLCMFSYDDKILILQGDKKKEWDTRTNEVQITGELENIDWGMQGEPCIMNNEIYFISNHILYRYDISQSQVSLVKVLNG